MVRFFNNPITNPFYRDVKSEAPDALAVREAANGDSYAANGDGTAYGPNENAKTDPYVNEESASDSSSITSDYQDGLKKAESVAIVWSKWSLIGTYVWYVFQSSTYFPAEQRG